MMVRLILDFCIEVNIRFQLILLYIYLLFNKMLWNFIFENLERKNCIAYTVSLLIVESQ